MSGDVLRVVFDCGVLIQALAFPLGPSGRCVRGVTADAFELVMPACVWREFQVVTSRPRVMARFQLTPEKVSRFVADLVPLSVTVDVRPIRFDRLRDRADMDYIAAAIETKAGYLVSRDQDLLVLDGHEELSAVAPGLRVVDPANFLRLVDPTDETGFSRF